LGEEASGAIARQLRDPFEATPDVREVLSWIGNAIERSWGVTHREVTHNRFPARFALFVEVIVDVFHRRSPREWAT